MAKKTKVRKSSINKETLNEIRHLEGLVKYSLRAICGQSENLDNYFNNQANRLNNKIKELKQKQ